MKPKQWVMFTGLGLIWGSSFFWIKIALAEVGPFLLVAIRLGLGLLGMLAGMAVRRPSFWQPNRVWVMIALLGLTNSAAPFSLVAWGSQFIDSSVVSILVASVPIFTVILSLFWLRDEPLTADKVIGVVIGFAGVVVLFWRGVANAGDQALWGQAAVLGAAVLFGVSGVVARREMKGVDPMIQAFGSLLFADAAMWALALATGPVSFAGIGGLTWGALIWLGVLASSLGYHLQYNLIAQLGATRASFVTYLIPLVGLIFGVAILHEPFDSKLILGGFLILVSVLVVNRLRDQTTV
ncbi:MAG: DMT family transporter [Anaerolineales bacterium]|nr:DMT family transporter [Anaerolineales bacterium]